MQETWAKKGVIFYGFLLVLMILLNVFQIASAECSDTDPTGCADTKFSVSTYLRADQQGPTEDAFKNTIQSGIGGTIVKLINQLSYVIGSFALLTLIVAGFTYVTSAGQERLITKAKDMVKFAIMGLVVAMMAYYITAYVQSLFYEIGK